MKTIRAADVRLVLDEDNVATLYLDDEPAIKVECVERILLRVDHPDAEPLEGLDVNECGSDVTLYDQYNPPT